MPRPGRLGALDLVLPQGLRELIEAQLGQLGAPNSRCSKAASVVGAEAAVASVAAGSQMESGPWKRRVKGWRGRGGPGGPWAGGVARWDGERALWVAPCAVSGSRVSAPGAGRQGRCHRRVGARLETGVWGTGAAR